MQLSSNFCNLFKLIATSHAKLLPETNSFQVILFFAREARRGTSPWSQQHGATHPLRVEARVGNKPGHHCEPDRSPLAAAQHLPAQKCAGKQVWACCTPLFAALSQSGDGSTLPLPDPICVVASWAWQPAAWRSLVPTDEALLAVPRAPMLSGLAQYFPF